MAGLVKELRLEIERLRLEIETATSYTAALKLDLAAAERLLASKPKVGRRPKNKLANVAPMPVPRIPKTVNGRNKTKVALEVIRRASETGVTADEIYEVFREQGLKAKRNYVFNITSRLKSKGVLDQRGDRFYLAS